MTGGTSLDDGSLDDVSIGDDPPVDVDCASDVDDELPPPEHEATTSATTMRPVLTA